MNVTTTATPTLVREDDQLEHIEDTPLFTAIRNNRFVQLPWNALDESERRQVQVNLFNPCGL